MNYTERTFVQLYDQRLVKPFIGPVADIIASIRSKENWKGTLKQHFLMKIIPTKSCFGIVLTASYHSSPDDIVCVLKTAADRDEEHYNPRYEVDILHEVIIGCALPNMSCFARPLGYLLRDKRAILFQTYIPGSSLVHTNVQLEDIEDIFIQVAYALHVAKTSCKFMHLDLHGGNVLCQPKQAKVNVFGVTRQVNFVPTLIDYGMSTAEVGGIFIPNKWYHVNHKDEHILSLSANQETHLLPLYDFYRYCTYVMVKLEWLPPAFVQKWMNYFYTMSSHKHEVLSESKVLCEKGNLLDWRKHYMKHNLNIPNKALVDAFSEGSLEEWIKEV